MADAIVNEAQAGAPQRERVVIDARGDLLLRCRGIELVVSSRTMRLASPKFDAMIELNPDFLELDSVELIFPPDAPPTLVLDLPEEDDDKAVVILAAIAHHQTDLHVPALPSERNLVQLAILADKYDCKKYLRFHGLIWAFWLLHEDNSQRFSVREGTAPHERGIYNIKWLADILFFSFVADLPETFMVCSKAIIMRHSQSPVDVLQNGFFLPEILDHPLLRDVDLRDALQRALAQLSSQVNEILVSPVGPGDTHDLSSRCVHYQAAHQLYQHALRTKGVLPWTWFLPSPSGQAQVRALGPDCIDKCASIPASPMLIHYRRACPCGGNDYDFLGGLRAQAQRLKHQGLPSLCLDCLKTNGESFRHNACRCKHPAHSG